jgi:hypothetical protein
VGAQAPHGGVAAPALGDLARQHLREGHLTGEIEHRSHVTGTIAIGKQTKTKQSETKENKAVGIFFSLSKE